MTAQDNRQETIRITVSTQTDNGANWEGTATLTGPYDAEMVAKAVEISDDLVSRAMGQSRRERLKQAVWEGVPEKPRRRRRSKAEIEAEQAEAAVPDGPANDDADVMLGEPDATPASPPAESPASNEDIGNVETDDDLPF